MLRRIPVRVGQSLLVVCVRTTLDQCYPYKAVLQGCPIQTELPKQSLNIAANFMLDRVGKSKQRLCFVHILGEELVRMQVLIADCKVLFFILGEA